VAYNSPVPTYRDEAVVLRTHQFGEADRVIILLTRAHGKVHAVAKGVRRTSSKFGGRLEPFQHIDIQFAQGHGLDIVTQAVSLHSSSLGADYSRFTAAQVLVETAERLVAEEGVPSLQQYRLLLGALLALDAEDRPAPLIVDSYLLRALAIAGYALATAACAGCGDVDVRWFSPQGGGAVCTACRTPGSAQLYPGDSAYLGALLAGDWAAVTAADRATQQRVDGMVVAYSTWHLERALRSLPFFER